MDLNTRKEYNFNTISFIHTKCGESNFKYLAGDKSSPSSFDIHSIDYSKIKCIECDNMDITEKQLLENIKNCQHKFQREEICNRNFILSCYGRCKLNVYIGGYPLEEEHFNVHVCCSGKDFNQDIGYQTTFNVDHKGTEKDFVIKKVYCLDCLREENAKFTSKIIRKFFNSCTHFWITDKYAQKGRIFIKLIFDQIVKMQNAKNAI